MKSLTSEQQMDLLEFLGKIDPASLDIETANRLSYWQIELKPKRVRKKAVLEIPDGIEPGPTEYTGPSPEYIWKGPETA